jgi:phospholipid-binding lipoprotein MlaA
MESILSRRKTGNSRPAGKMKLYTLTLFSLLAAAGCATKPASRQNLSPVSININLSDNSDFDEFEEELESKQVTIADPLESWNRAMYGINDKLYFWVAKPVIEGYEKHIPKLIRTGTDNFFQNLTTPVRFVNCLAQRKCTGADRELKRFFINSTIGVLGIGDPARDRWHIEPAKEDLGQTLAIYGLGDGFYIVWPVFGPSTVRDSIGDIGDGFLNPAHYVEPVKAAIGISVFKRVNEGSFHTGEYETFKKSSVDPYIAMRNGYIQYRGKQIRE